MIDYHIHIGQFNEVYYDALEVFEAIEKSETSVNEVRYSSTSSCRDDVELEKIEEEIAYAQSYQGNLVVKPYLWFVPKYAELGISVNSATQKFDYCGIKLHPFAQHWDFENPVHKKCLEEIFDWSEKTEKDILIHCGRDKTSNPLRWEEFFKNFPNAKPILAHSNPLDETISVLQKYKNARCDTAVLRKNDFEALLKSEVKDRVLFGSDFPITHYFSKKRNEEDQSLIKIYENDFRKL